MVSVDVKQNFNQVNDSSSENEDLIYIFVLLFLIVTFCPGFCHVDIDVCIYSTGAFLIVKWMLMLIMYSAANS